MPDINTEQVLNGTFHKRLYQGYQKMKSSGLTNESAMKYKTIYENAPLSDILRESTLIFSEPLHGLDFYTNIMCEAKIPLHQFPIQENAFNTFISEYEKSMGNEMLTKYKDSQLKINAVMESRKNEILFSQFHLSDDIEQKVEEMCDDLYEYGNSVTIPSIESFFEEASLENQILYGYYILQNYNENKLSNILHKNMVVTESTDSDPDLYKSAARSNVISTYLMQDSAIVKDSLWNRNRNLKDLMNEAACEDYGRVIDSIFSESVTNVKIPEYVGESAVMEMFDEDERNEIMQEDFLNTRLANAYKAKSILEAALDIVYNEYTVIASDNEPSPSIIKQIFNSDVDIPLKESVDILIEKVNSMDDIIHIILEDSDDEDDAFFEYTRRGEATPTIRSQTGNVREELPSSSGENRKKQSSKQELDNEEDDEDEDDEDIESQVEKTKGKPSESSKIQKLKNDESQKEEKSTKTNKKPELQKQSLTRKIQNKAIDMDVKMQKAAGNASEKITELKNAGKAVLRLPANIMNKMKTTIEEWNTMDEEKRKEKILRPGYRTQIFKMLKTAIVYGAIWEWKKYMVIVAWICKHTILHPFFKASKQRSERLRNELTAELETEIAVTEEKINDASSNGDQKQKYELIRIKKKLEAEKVRVSTNSKYI